MARSATTKSAEVAESPRQFPWKPLAVFAVVALGIAAIVIFDPEPPGTAFASLGNTHLSSPDQPHAPYNSSPPSSGPHFGGLGEWGVHDEPMPPEVFVHNLEDGGVVFTYDCAEPCGDLVSGLTEIVGDGSRRLLTPYEGISNDGQDFRAAAVAWTKVYYFDELTDQVRDELETFVGLHEGVDHHVTSN